MTEHLKPGDLLIDAHGERWFASFERKGALYAFGLGGDEATVDALDSPRRLIVLDPESEADVERLREAFAAGGVVYAGDDAQEVLDALARPEPHIHAAVEDYSHPAYHPSMFEETCACGATRYRVRGGPWTEWEIVTPEEHGPLTIIDPKDAR